MLLTCTHFDLVHLCGYRMNFGINCRIGKVIYFLLVFCKEFNK